MGLVKKYWKTILLCSLLVCLCLFGKNCDKDSESKTIEKTKIEYIENTEKIDSLNALYKATLEVQVRMQDSISRYFEQQWRTSETKTIIMRAYKDSIVYQEIYTSNSEMLTKSEETIKSLKDSILRLQTEAQIVEVGKVKESKEFHQETYKEEIKKSYASKSRKIYAEWNPLNSMINVGLGAEFFGIAELKAYCNLEDYKKPNLGIALEAHWKF